MPTGLNVQAIFIASIVTSSSNGYSAYFSDLAANDEAATYNPTTIQITNAVVGVAGFGTFQIRTSTSAQIRFRLSASEASTVLKVTTQAWIDTRGRFPGMCQ